LAGTKKFKVTTFFCSSARTEDIFTVFVQIQEQAGSTALPASLPCQPACLVSLPTLSACLRFQSAWLVNLPALSACLPYQPALLVSKPALPACLLCFVPSTSPCSSEWIFLAASNNTNYPNQAGGTYH
jgi:hypothetical protein